MKYIKIFDKSHKQLDEVSEFSSLRYTFTLNSMGKCEFGIGLNNPKCTKENFKAMNEVEIWEGNLIVWWGVMTAFDFGSGMLQTYCYDYLFFFNKTIELPYDFNNMSISDSISTIIANVNFFRGCNFALGNIDSSLLKIGNLTFDNETNSYERLQEIMKKFNYDFDIDSNKRLNVYKRKGSVKNNYVLQFGTEADNIVEEPTLSINAFDMANAIRSDTEYYASTQKDNDSIKEYGKLGAAYSATGDPTQNDLDNETYAELQRRAYPLSSVSLSAVDSVLCPLNDINVGDSIPIYIKPYLEYEDVQRIIEFTHEENTGQRSFVLGQALYKPQKLQTKFYTR